MAILLEFHCSAGEARGFWARRRERWAMHPKVGVLKHNCLPTVTTTGPSGDASALLCKQPELLSQLGFQELNRLRSCGGGGLESGCENGGYFGRGFFLRGV